MTQAEPSADARVSRLRSLRVRLLADFLLVALIPLGLLAIWSVRQTSRTVDRITRDTLLDECALGALELEKAVGQAQSDLFFLTQLPSLRSAMHGVPWPRSGHEPTELSRELARVVARDPRYSGAAYVNDLGEEMARVLRAKDAVQVIPPARLRNVGLDNFLRQGMRLVAGRVLISGLDLADPSEPSSGAVLRFLTRVFDDQNHRRGALVLELRIETVLEQLRLGGITSERLLLIDPRGLYLEHPRPPRRPESAPWRLDLAERFPLVAGALESTEPVVRESPEGAVAAIRPLRLAGSELPWQMATIRSRDAVREPVAKARQAALVVVLFAAALALALGFITAARMSRPLLRLARDATALGRGDFSVRARAETGDEIEILADAMNRMARELEGLYQGLEGRIRDKTREITEAHDRLKSAYQSLEETHRRLQESEAELVQAEKLSSVGRLAASVAHEINNPSGIVSMYAQLLREETSDPAVRDRLTIIVESAEKVSRTVRALLDFSRRSPLEPERVPVAELIAEAAGELQARDPAMQVVIASEVPPELAVSGDRAQLVQVFRNLIENAAHAMDRRGRVLLHGGVRDGQVEIQVDDQGPGIPPEVLPRLFEPFFTTKRAGAGTGLGLFVCYGIVKSHRGGLRAENLPGGGARFTLTLPVATERAFAP